MNACGSFNSTVHTSYTLGEIKPLRLNAEMEV